MRKEVLLVLIGIFIILMGGIVLFLAKKGSQTMSAIENTQDQLAQANNLGLAAYTDTEISQHNNSGDCWLVNSEKVYNLTGFLSNYPTPPEKLKAFCGADATRLFSTNVEIKNIKGVLDKLIIGYRSGQ